MKTLGTLLAIVLTMSPVAIVNAQNAQPGAAPNIATKKDVQRAVSGLAKQVQKSADDIKTDVARKIKDQAVADQKANDDANRKRDADQALLNRATAAREARMQAIVIGGCALLFIAIALCIFILTRRRQSQERESRTTTTKSPRPEDLYGSFPSPSKVKQCMQDHGLTEARFTINLPDIDMIFEYRAVVGNDGEVTARFAGNGNEITSMKQLRKRASELYANGNGPLRPITIKSTGIRRVS